MRHPRTLVLARPLADHALPCRNGAKVTLYESEKTLGGHTLTDDSSGYPVDLGFQVTCSWVVQRVSGCSWWG